MVSGVGNVVESMHGELAVFVLSQTPSQKTPLVLLHHQVAWTFANSSLSDCDDVGGDRAPASIVLSQV